MNKVSGKRIGFYLHLIAWAFVFILPVYLYTYSPGRNSDFLVKIYFRTILYLCIFYINYFYLVPNLYLKGKKLKHLIWVTLVIVVFYFINEYVNHSISDIPAYKHIRETFDMLAHEYNLPRPPRNLDVFNYFFTSILISGFSLGLRMIGRYNENEKQRKELEKERINSELALLKNQVSPHFFFNTLNNIYSLVEINKADAQKAILHLSKMMRYLLYESEKGNTTLAREIDFMKNYVELMRLRVNDKVKLDISFPENYKDCTIAPLLFISFIENSFKHGVSYTEPSFIHISMEMVDAKLHFNCSNSVFDVVENRPPEESGIGLENIKKRLRLLYENRHELTILKSADSFDVQLTIDLL
jgi:two-component system, LytTR family, sensor kinase